MNRVLCALFFFWLQEVAETVSQHPKLLLLSFDGFRHDLLNETLVPHITEWAKKGVWFSSGIKSQYITYTAPNHMSISTGLYEQNHGIVSNYFYDPETKTYFDYFNATKKPGIVNSSLSEYWYHGDPIWLTNERVEKTRSSAALYWPNCDAPFPFFPHKPRTFKSWQKYGTLTDWMKDTDDIVEMFARPDDPVNFVAWYVAEPDHILHTNGFYNGELRKTLTYLDDLFYYLLKKLETNGLDDEINIILTADHGHAEIIDERHVMCIPDYVSGKSFEMGDHMIYPQDEQHAQEIYKNLTEAVAKHGFRVNVHLKEDFPENFHYKNTSRVGRIILEPLIGSAVSFSCTSKKLENTYGDNGTSKFNSSTHGMDPSFSEMRAFLIMKGPAFAEQVQVDEIPENVDLYQLMCHVLNITASKNDGSFEIVRKALRGYHRSGGNHGIVFNFITDTMSLLFILVPSMCIVCLFLVYGCKNTVLKNDPKWGRSETNQGYRPLNNAVDSEGFDVEGNEDRRQTRMSLNGQLNSGTVSMSGLLDELSEDEL